MKKYIVLIFFLAFVNCLRNITLVPITSEMQLLKSYKLNEEQSVSVGDPIIDIKRAEPIEVYKVLFDYKPPTIGNSETQQNLLKKGDRFFAVAHVANDQDALLVISQDDLNNDKDEDKLLIHIFPDGKINRGWCWSLGFIPVQGIWTEKKLFEKSTTEEFGKVSFRSQIIYSGIGGNTIRATYREFSNNLARPAFTQELQYNLDESNIISYRSIKIKVIKATNSYINYKILDDGGLSWFPK